MWKAKYQTANLHGCTLMLGKQQGMTKRQTVMSCLIFVTANMFYF